MTILSRSKMTAEQEILLLCCRRHLDGPATARLRHLQAGPVDWPQVAMLADSQDIWPLFAARLANLETPAPASVSQPLQQRLLENTALNITLTKQLGTVLRMLEAHGIPALAFKGPSFAAHAYGHVGLRRFNDLDILVAPELIRAARAHLLASGFALTRTDLESLCPWAGSEEVFVPVRRDWAPMEIQSRPWKWPMALRLDTPALIARGRRVEAAGVSIPTLAPEDLLLVLATHGLYHGWTQLRFVCDIDGAAHLNPDWPTVVERARHARAGRILSIALILAATVLETDSGLALAWARKDRVAAALAQQIARRLFEPPHRLLRHPLKDWIRFRSREHVADKIRYCVRTVAFERVIVPLDWIRRAAQRNRARAGARGQALE